MTPEEIYNLFKQELDGEEFEDDESAERAMNVAYRKILAERDWEILRRTLNLPAGTTSLASIASTFDKLLDVWATKGVANDQIPLKKANYRNRFDYDDEPKDYYYDHVNNAIAFIHSGVWELYDLIADYKYKPAKLTLSGDAEPIFPDTYHPRIAYEMVLAYKRGDESFDGYREVMQKDEELENLMVDWNESLIED